MAGGQIKAELCKRKIDEVYQSEPIFATFATLAIYLKRRNDEGCRSEPEC
jgi:hypothetical protein